MTATEADALHPNSLADLCAPDNPFVGARLFSGGVYLDYGNSNPRGDKNFVMSRSELFEFANNPRRWRDGYRDGDTEEKDWGTLMDICVLDSAHILDRVAVEPDTYVNSDGDEKPWNNNSKTCRQWAADRKGKLIIKPKVMQKASAAIEAVPEEVAALVRSSKTQVMFLAEYNDADTGIAVPFKGLIDAVPAGEWENELADFKTCRSAHPRAWESHCYSYGYHWQAQLYLWGYNKATGESRNGFLHIVQESEHPYYCELTRLDDIFIRMANDEIKEALRLYCECLKTGKWPGYKATRIHGVRITNPPQWTLSSYK